MKQTTLAPAPSDIGVRVAEYVCGLLGTEERAEMHLLLSRDDEALAQALAWEERFLALVDALPRAQPTPALRERLQRTLGIEPPPAHQPPPKPLLLQRESLDAPELPRSPLPATTASPSGSKGRNKIARRPLSSGDPVLNAPQPDPVTPPSAAPSSSKSNRSNDSSSFSNSDHYNARGAADSTTQAATRPSATGSAAPGKDDRTAHRTLVRKLWFWRLIGLCSTTAAIVSLLLPGEPPPPPVQVVKVAPTRAAILQAPGTTSTPGWTATLDPQGNLVLLPLVRTVVPDGSQVLLWTRSERIPEPRLLGRIDPNRPVQVPATTIGALADDQLLEMTLERDADAAKGVPHGPILFIGQMTVFGSVAASTEMSRGTVESASSASAGGQVVQAPQR